MYDSAIETMLRDSGALLEGHFLLSSGRHSDRYVQCALLLQYPDRAEAALKPLADRLRRAIGAGVIAVDAVVGPALGGVIVAYELARQLGLPAFFTERGADGAMSLRRGFTVRAGSSLLVAEDVITTAASAEETAAVLEAHGARVTALACLVDRRATSLAPPRFPLYAACTLRVDDWDAAECALCAQERPLVKPGSRPTPTA